MAFSTNTLLTPTIIAKEALMMLENNLVMGNLVHRRYKEEFKKIGGTITIRKPNKFQVTKARTRTTSVISEKSITLNVATQAHVSWEFTSVDLALTIEEYSERYIKPAAEALANQVDADLLALYDDIYNQVEETSSWASTPASFLVLGKAGQRMDEESVPQDGRVVVLNPAANWAMANALRTLYVTDIAKPAVVKGYLAKIAGMEIYMDQNVAVHQMGDAGFNTNTSSHIHMTAAMTSKTTNDVVTILNVLRIASKAFKIGDVFTIAGVNAVNPISGLSTGTLRHFVVTADASCQETTGTTSGQTLIYVDPPLIHTGPDKNVDTLPAAAAVIGIQGNIAAQMPMNLAFHKNAFALVMVELNMPHGAWGASYSRKGMSIRIVKDYEIGQDVEMCRLDILYGVKTLYPELAVRIAGKQANEQS